ncbi:MAG TPA: sugar ABC transporter permease, partial [Ramlibacter sp.]|nr:sugar ABC transporter permease [Ramlibacter sp.]
MRGASAAGSSHTAIQAWLLLLPALVLLVAFTHWPTAATLFDSFHSAPKGARQAVWVGLENYQAMAEDPVFWQAVKNNLWFAGATIPLSIALALAMA